MRALVYIILLLTSLGCSHQQDLQKEPVPAQSAVNTNLSPSYTDEPTVTDPDTLFINNEGVVFFTPSVQELQNISPDQGTVEGVSMAVGDFAYYASIVADSLEQHAIPVVFTDKKYIAIPLEAGPVLVDRAQNGSFMGLVAFDGQNAPLVINGLHTHLSMWASITDYFSVEHQQALPLWDYFKSAVPQDLHIYSSHSDILNQTGQRLDPSYHSKFGAAASRRADKFRMSFYGYYKFALKDSLMATVCRIPSRYDESAINLYIWDQVTQTVTQQLPLAENIWNDQWIMVMDSWINGEPANGSFEIIQRKKEARMKDGQRQEWDSLYRWVWKGHGFVRAGTQGLAKRNFPLKDWASYEEPPTPHTANQVTITDEDFVWLPLETGDLTWENVILEIPKPYTVEKEPIANQINQSQIDTIYTLKQRELQFKFYRTPEKHHVIEGRVGNNSMVFKNGLQVGITKSQFQSLFTKLSQRNSIPDRVTVRSSQGDRVFTCKFQNDTLMSIELTNYLH